MKSSALSSTQTSPLSHYASLLALDLKSLSLYRGLLGIFILQDILARVVTLKPFYSDEGIFSRAAAVQFASPWDFSLQYLTGSFSFPVVLFVLQGIFAVMLVIGWKTRWAIFACWLLHLSASLRNPMLLTADEKITSFLLFWSQFLPLGCLTSVDSPAISSEESTPPCASIGTFAFTSHIFFLYGISLFSKIGDSPWWEGAAMFHAIASDSFMDSQGMVYLNFPRLLQFSTYAVFGLEVVGVVSLLLGILIGWEGVRLFAVFLLIWLAIALRMVFGVHPIPLILPLSLLSMIPGKFWYGKAALRVLDFFSRGLRALAILWPGRERAQAERSQGQVLPLASPTGNAVVLFFLVCFFWYQGAQWSSRNTPEPISALVAFLHLDLVREDFVWPGTIAYSFAAPGNLGNGSRVDLLKEGGPLSRQVPSWIAPRFKSRDWKALFQTLAYSYSAGDPDTDSLASYVADYLCRDWNGYRMESYHVEELSLVMRYRDVLPSQELSPPLELSPFKYRCGEAEAI